jgi:hypothetical protein
MAIFGSLADLPFPELMGLVGQRTGKLFINNPTTKKKFEWHLHEATICGLIVNQKTMDDVMQVRGCMIELIEDADSNFEFHKQDFQSLQHYFRLGTEQLILSTAAAMDELQEFRRFFSHEVTYFRTSGKMDIWLDEHLASFWERSVVYLEQGCNAVTLANLLNLNIDQVQLNLYKLRSVGKLVPMRLFDQQAAGQRPTATIIERPVGFPQEHKKTSLLGRSHPMFEQQIPTGSALPAKAKSLVGRMLKALSLNNLVRG